MHIHQADMLKELGKCNRIWLAKSVHCNAGVVARCLYIYLHIYVLCMYVYRLYSLSLSTLT